MDNQPPPTPGPSQPRKRPCLWIGTTGCALLLALLALLVAVVVLLVRFIWGLRLDQWL